MAHVRLSLLEAAAHNPKFADQQVGYLITKAKWSALNYFDHERVDHRHVFEEPVFMNDDGEKFCAFDEILPASLPSPEEIADYHETAARLEAAITTLPTDQQKIARLLADGYDAPAIAEKIGKSTSNVCHITTRLRANLSAALADQLPGDEAPHPQCRGHETSESVMCWTRNMATFGGPIPNRGTSK